MADKIAEIRVAFVVGGMFWLIGFWVQRISNAHDAIDDSLTANGFWAYLFGVRPGKERLYLRIATLQALGLAYLVFAVVTVWFWDAETVRKVGQTSLGIGLALLIFFWSTVNLLNRHK